MSSYDDWLTTVCVKSIRPGIKIYTLVAPYVEFLPPASHMRKLDRQIRRDGGGWVLVYTEVEEGVFQKLPYNSSAERMNVYQIIKRRQDKAAGYEE